jgi:hypothetical protein
MVDPEIRSFAHFLFQALSEVPLLHTGQIAWLRGLKAGIPERIRDKKVWMARRNREAKQAIQFLVDEGRLKAYPVHNYFLQEIVHAGPIASWAPGEPDLDYPTVHAAIERHLRKATYPSANRPKLTAFFIPTIFERANLQGRFYRETVQVAESNCESASGVESVRALRVASLFLSLHFHRPEEVRTWKLTDTERNVFDLRTEILPEAFVYRAGQPVALRTSELRWGRERFDEYQQMMKRQNCRHEIW